MGFIPFDERGKQQYRYDSRPLRVKVSMWLWKHVGISLFGKTHRGKTFMYEQITGEKARYLNCTFKQCKFDGLRLVFINDSYIEYSTPFPEFRNMNTCEIRNCAFKKVKPTIGEEKRGSP